MIFKSRKIILITFICFVVCWGVLLYRACGYSKKSAKSKAVIELEDIAEHDEALQLKNDQKRK